MSAIPAHSPYRAGDRVQMHGYAGYHVRYGQSLNDRAVIGFRGVVESYAGGTILTGTTDAGRPWTEEWGALTRDGRPCSGCLCGCCPHPGWRCQPELADPVRARQAAEDMAVWWRTGVRPVREQYGQLDLFAS